MRADSSGKDSSNEESLFSPEELPPHVQPEPKVKSISRPIWTENKAKLIERYLRYFVFITKHGTYIDGFAGPQEPDEPGMWAAKLVLESDPKWFRHFYLFDKGRDQIKSLQALKAAQPLLDGKGKPLKREIKITRGDFNRELEALLATQPIAPKEATFCLLDQRTFECEWSSLEQLAAYKPPDHNKIELFYFLATGWLGRSLAGQQDKDTLRRWWGRDDYESVRLMTTEEKIRAFVTRFKQDLGYKSVKPWPIYEKQTGRRIMYNMIHATDHPLAPGLMARAYNNAVRPPESHDQLSLELGLLAKDIDE